MSRGTTHILRSLRRLARTLVFAFSLTVMALLGSGCVESAIAAAGATAGFGLAQGQAESFIRGELKSSRRVTQAQAQAATIIALNELQLELREQRQGPYDGYIRGKAEGGREIKVYFKCDSPVMTRISIRVGFMGDMSVSRLVMDHIDRALGTVSPASSPAAEHP